MLHIISRLGYFIFDCRHRYLFRTVLVLFHPVSIRTYHTPSPNSSDTGPASCVGVLDPVPTPVSPASVYLRGNRQSAH